MKLTIFALLAISALIVPTSAQETSPEIQAMSGKIMREVSEGLQCQAASIKLTRENEALRARVKELEAAKSPSSK